MRIGSGLAVLDTWGSVAYAGEMNFSTACLLGGVTILTVFFGKT